MQATEKLKALVNHNKDLGKLALILTGIYMFVAADVHFQISGILLIKSEGRCHANKNFAYLTLPKKINEEEEEILFNATKPHISFIVPMPFWWAGAFTNLILKNQRGQRVQPGAAE